MADLEPKELYDWIKDDLIAGTLDGTEELHLAGATESEKSTTQAVADLAVIRSADEPINPTPGLLWIDLDEDAPGSVTTTVKGTGGTAVSGEVLIEGVGAVSTSQVGNTITIATTAEANVQADWDQAVNTEDDYIKNKPTIPDLATLHKSASFTAPSNTSAATGAITIDWSANQSYLQAEPTGTITYTFTAPSGPAHLQLFIDSDGTSTAQTMNFPTLTWLGSTWTPISNKKAVISIWYDGSAYYAMGSNQV